MSVKLSKKDQQMLEGHHGGAAKLAMSILVRMADVYGATEMMDVSQAHVDACGILIDSGLEFVEILAGLGGRVSVPTTLNMVPLDLQNWRRLGTPEEFAIKATRLAKAYTDMGCIPTWTCAPYQGYLTPRFGQQIAWAESNAIVYANSVLGARTNRYADFMDICAAIAGRVPKSGLHISANRKGQLLLRLVDIEPAILESDIFYPVLGHLIGYLAQDRIPVIDGLPAAATSDQLKALGAATASSGGVGLFHAVGVTPEANSLEDAFQGDAPEEIVEVHLADLVKARADLSTADEGEKLDAVVLGCPHFSYAQFQQLAELIRSEELRAALPAVRLLVVTNQVAYGLLQRSDIAGMIEGFGIEVVLDTCVLSSPILSSDAQVVMTDSAKWAYYAPGALGVSVAFGSLRDCVRSATRGVVQREETSW
ncbi:MAG TPA: aconitase X catalytic domain-containing protein [Anaerolineae bacterium]|nr:aconitase X catalytic domain-containing protein [Anaerolineae bacterium]